MLSLCLDYVNVKKLCLLKRIVYGKEEKKMLKIV